MHGKEFGCSSCELFTISIRTFLAMHFEKISTISLFCIDFFFISMHRKKKRSSRTAVLWFQVGCNCRFWWRKKRHRCLVPALLHVHVDVHKLRNRRIRSSMPMLSCARKGSSTAEGRSRMSDRSSQELWERTGGRLKSPKRYREGREKRERERDIVGEASRGSIIAGGLMRRHNCTIIDDRFIRRPDLLPILSSSSPFVGLELQIAVHRGHRFVAIAYYYDEERLCSEGRGRQVCQAGQKWQLLRTRLNVTLSSPLTVDSGERGVQCHCCLAAGIIVIRQNLLSNTKKLKHNM